MSSERMVESNFQRNITTSVIVIGITALIFYLYRRKRNIIIISNENIVINGNIIQSTGNGEVIHKTEMFETVHIKSYIYKVLNKYNDSWLKKLAQTNNTRIEKTESSNKTNKSNIKKNSIRSLNEQVDLTISGILYENVAATVEAIKNQSKEMKLHVFAIPNFCCSFIIGRQGKNIKRLESTYNVKILIEDQNDDWSDNNISNVRCNQTNIAIYGYNQSVDQVYLEINQIVIGRIKDESKTLENGKLVDYNPKRMIDTKKIVVNNNNKKEHFIVDESQLRTIYNNEYGLSFDKIDITNISHEAYITNISSDEGPYLFWVVLNNHKLEANEEQNKKLTNMALTGALKKPCTFPIEIGQMVCALFPADGNYYRAIILKTYEEMDMVHVFYVDFGDSAVIHIKECYNLGSQFMQDPFTALPCRLYGLKPSHENHHRPDLSSLFKKVTYRSDPMKITIQLSSFDSSIPIFEANIFSSEVDPMDVSTYLILNGFEDYFTKIGNTIDSLDEEDNDSLKNKRKSTDFTGNLIVKELQIRRSRDNSVGNSIDDLSMSTNSENSFNRTFIYKDILLNDKRISSDEEQYGNKLIDNGLSPDLSKDMNNLVSNTSLLSDNPDDFKSACSSDF